MNIKQLKYVCSIVDLGSFSAAAAHEGVSVQAVSKAMGELEGKLGAPLFERGSAGVRPTAFGRAFCDRARRVLAEWGGLERFVSDGPSGPDGARPFVMGFCAPEFRGVGRFCALIAAVSERVLGRKVRVEVVPCEEGLPLLRAEALDAAITVGPVEGEGIVCGRLGTMSSAVLLGVGHPLAGREVVTLEELSAYPVFRPTDYAHYSEFVVDAYREHGLQSEVYEAPTREADPEFFSVRNGFTFIVAGGLGWSSAESVMRPLAKGDALAIPICLSTPRGAGVDYVAFRRALASMSLFS